MSPRLVAQPDQEAGPQHVDPHAVADALVAIEEIEDLEGWAGRFALLSDPTRLRLLFALHRTGGLCVSDLAATVGMSDSSVSHALRLLRERGWVRAEREGRLVVYRMDDETVHELLHRIGAGHGPRHRHR
nr:metalloregulator ArsR/SmtB family transcription factor [uncultured Actinotalea sp.]